jgi:hypothetical protein
MIDCDGVLTTTPHVYIYHHQYSSHSCRPIHRSGVEVLQVNRFATLPFGEKAARRR